MTVLTPPSVVPTSEIVEEIELSWFSGPGQDDVPTEPNGASSVESFFTDDGHSYLGDSPNPLYTHTNAATSTLSLSSAISSLSATTADSVAGYLVTNRKGRTITLSKLCDAVDECHTLEQAHILSVGCYRERSWTGVLHRTLILHLRRPRRSDIWLRVDRLRGEGTSILQLLLGLGTTKANDVAQLAASKSDLLKQPDINPESLIDFVLPPSLGAFCICLKAIREELVEYRVWPENCWFMCSLLQEHLMAAGHGTFVRGKNIEFGLDSPTRGKVWDRTSVLRPSPSKVLERILSEGAPHETAENLKQMLTINAQLKVQNDANVSSQSNRRLVYDMAAIQSVLLSHVVRQGSQFAALMHAFDFEHSVSQHQYPVHAMRLYATLAYPEDPIYARLRVLNITRALYVGNPSRDWWRLASQLVEFAKVGSISHPSLSAAFAAEARSILAADPTRRLWGADRTVILKGHMETVSPVAFTLDGKLLASGSGDNTINLWDASTGEKVGEAMLVRLNFVRCVTFSPDGKQLVFGFDDGMIQRWDVSSGREAWKPLQHASSKAINCVAFSPNGTLIASGSDDTTIHIWDVSTSERLGQPLSGHTRRVWSLTFSPDGKRIVSGSSDNTVRLWDVTTGKAIGKPLIGHAWGVWFVVFSPDSKLVASGSQDRTVRRWDATTGKPVGGAMEGHTDGVNCVAFSPDGKTIASSSEDGTLRLWDSITGKSIGEPLEGHMGPVCSVAFSPDGRQLVSCSSDKTIRIWYSVTMDRGPVGE